MLREMDDLHRDIFFEVHETTISEVAFEANEILHEANRLADLE